MKKAVFSKMLMAISLTMGIVFASCQPNKQEVELKKIQGTLEGSMVSDSIPEQVAKMMANTTKLHNHDILSDTVNDISVSCIDETDLGSTEGYGIVVVKGAQSTTFKEIQHLREPWAVYNNITGDLWLTSCVMSGTGVHVECLYQIRFNEDDKAYIAGTIDPYDIQRAFANLTGYTVDGEQITIYIDHVPSVVVTNTVTDMGGFDDDAVWVGEQISYDLSKKKPRICIVPGVKYVTGLMLHYDDMPEFIADIMLDNEGAFAISKFEIKNKTKEQ